MKKTMEMRMNKVMTAKAAKQTLAAVVMTVIPTIVVYLILHDKVMEGMTAGAVKG